MASRAEFIKVAKPYIGATKGSKKHKDLVDTFNKKHPNGEYGNYSCAWCAITDTALSLKLCLTDKQTAMSYNCGTVITLAKKLNIWVEDDNYLPKIGDSIIYSWNDKTGTKSDCKSGASHIGRVWFVRGNDFIIFEGNMGSGYVGFRHIKRNQNYIRGYVKHPLTNDGAIDYSITVDGDWGVQTDFLTQVVMNVAVDLEVGKNTWKAIQKLVGATQDGDPGPKTYKAMQTFLKNKGFYTGAIDGIKGTGTNKAWQKWLNKQVKPVEKKGYEGEFPKLEQREVNILQATSNRDNWEIPYKYSKTESNHYHWTRVIRPNKCASKIVDGMQKIVNNRLITYKNVKTNALYSLAEKVGFDSSKVTKKTTCNCGNGLCVALHYAGFENAPKTLHSGKAWTNLKPLGFTSLTDKKYLTTSANLKNGDLLQAEGCPHIAVAKVFNRNYLKKGDSGEDVLRLQKLLVWLGYNIGKYGTDSEYGNDVTTAVINFEKDNGLEPDGKWGVKCNAKAKEIKK